jgi:hypothetical protein
MGKNSPSRYRSEGRNAFYRGGRPIDHLPYRSSTDGRARDWLEGWMLEKRDDDIKIKEEAAAAIEDQEKVEEFARLYNLAKEQGLI